MSGPLKLGKNHRWRVVAAALRRSRRGDAQIVLDLRVGDGHGAVPLRETLTFSPRARFRVAQFLKSAGRYPGDGAALRLEPDAAVGLAGWCTVGHEHDARIGRDHAFVALWLEADVQAPPRF